MASGNVLRNRKRFVSERLRIRDGEQILFGSVDGEAMVLDDWWELNNRARLDRLSSRMNRTRMTLIPTNQRLVFYQANDLLKPDKMAEIPIDDLRDVTFDLYPEKDRKGKRKIYALAAFVTDRYSESASVMFRTEISDLFTFNAERRVILPGICRLAGIPLSDITDYEMVEQSGIAMELTNMSRDIYDDMLENGEPPLDASHVELPRPDAPVYDAGMAGVRSRRQRPPRDSRRQGGRPRPNNHGDGYGDRHGSRRDDRYGDRRDGRRHPDEMRHDERYPGDRHYDDRYPDERQYDDRYPDDRRYDDRYPDDRRYDEHAPRR